MKNILIVLSLALFIFSCKKAEYIEPIIPSVDYKVADTMKLNISYNTSDPTFYTNYNNKIYADAEINASSNFNVDTSGVTIFFKDNTASKGNTLTVKFVGKTLENVSGTYNLAGNNQVKYTHSQNFNGSTFAQNTFKPFESGSININYSLSNNFVYGTLTNAKHFVGVHIPYQAAGSGVAQTLSQANILLANQSVRTYNVIFNFIKRL
jgi:hypothetical protein